ncbi:lysophospholipid acyltransferase family protein [Ectothiorhodospiraceae bacterium WFHF3C12]|nr:lysophospholipid acyltransferase family protein [Ectothiorhodospiraceae bacterium WFHF3C12]
MVDRAISAVVGAGLKALSLLPLPVLHALGSVLGALLWIVPNPARSNALANLAVCLPDRDALERRRIARQSLRELGKVFAEMGVFWYASPRRLNRLVREVEGFELVEEAMRSGRGMLDIVPHLGAWELLPVYFAQHVPANAMYRPPRLRSFEPLIRSARARTGCRLWPASAAGVRGAFKVLRQGEALAVLPDQTPPDEGVYVAFFGGPAKTMTLVPKLANKTGTMPLVMVAERLPRGRGFRIRLTPAPEDVASADVHVAAQAMNDAIAEAILRIPEQYQWTYRRFKRLPRGIPTPYQDPEGFLAGARAWREAGRPSPENTRRGRGRRKARKAASARR